MFLREALNAFMDLNNWLTNLIYSSCRTKAETIEVHILRAEGMYRED